MALCVLVFVIYYATVLPLVRTLEFKRKYYYHNTACNKTLQSLIFPRMQTPYACFSQKVPIMSTSNLSSNPAMNY